jgi:alginate O-acetyltransferase complex protein AlgI
MIFSSWQFITVFLPAVLLVFLSIPSRFGFFRKLWLSLASFIFYGYWRLEYVPLLALSILFNYGMAEWMFRNHGTRRAKWLLSLSIAANLGLLAYYKYADFLIQSLNAATGSRIGLLELILPLAISFFTFTQIAYLVDVYRDTAKHYDFLDYALFVVFFPHLIAGPIVRHWEIIPQYSPTMPRISRANLSLGLAIFLIGLYKKLLLADSISGTADLTFAAARSDVPLTWFDAWIGTLAYTLQIYFDFSGYSDMAIGLARMFSIKFPVNFDSPYKAGSISDFWRRWHISLMRFFREYLYIPLGGSRVGIPRHYANVMIVFLVSGLWHGAGWTFVAWGAAHGIYSSIHLAWSSFVSRLSPALRTNGFYRFSAITLTFLAVANSWVLFRAGSLEDARSILSSMWGLNGFTIPANIGEAQLGLGRLFLTLGASIVPADGCIPGLSHVWSVHCILVLLFIVWVLPNTQQLLAALDPICETVPNPARFQLCLSFSSGLLLALPFVFVLRSFIANQTSPFLYFNF